MKVMKNLVHGVGANDADYVVKPTINGRQVACPLYQTWRGMLERCYDPKFQAKRPSYIGCSVVPEWHSFMAFRVWMIKQDWQGRQLDKDLLIQGNKAYGPDACVFVSAKLNSFTTDSAATRGEFPLGVSWHEQRGKFMAQCCNPFTGRREYLGYFTCPDEAHEAWRSRKHELSLQLAEQQTDPRVAAALATRYLSRGNVT
jgi:hypothetical protein